MAEDRRSMSDSAIRNITLAINLGTTSGLHSHKAHIQNPCPRHCHTMPLLQMSQCGSNRNVRTLASRLHNCHHQLHVPPANHRPDDPNHMHHMSTGNPKWRTLRLERKLGRARRRSAGSRENERDLEGGRAGGGGGGKYLTWSR
jgi:hypothetical protein